MFGFLITQFLIDARKKYQFFVDTFFLMRTAGSVKRFLQPVLNISEKKNMGSTSCNVYYG